MKNLSIVGILCFLLGILVGYILFKEECQQIQPIKIEKPIELNFNKIDSSIKKIDTLQKKIKKLKITPITKLKEEVENLVTEDTNCKKEVDRLLIQNEYRDSSNKMKDLVINEYESVTEDQKNKIDTLSKEVDKITLISNNNYNISENQRVEKEKVIKQNKILKKIVVGTVLVLGVVITLIL